MQLSEHPSNDIVKLLLLGESGSGKTGSLASLALAGYNLRILDLDNGLDILRKLLSPNPEALSRVDFVTCTDKYTTVAGKPIPEGTPKAWTKAMNTLDKWDSFGSVYTWGPQEILVIDSLTLLSSAALKHVLALNGRIAGTPQIQDWGGAMQLTEDLLTLLYSNAVKCNVIVTSHITYIEREDGIAKGYPSALGNKLPPKVARFFNSVLMVRTRGTGSNTKRVIRTTSEGLIDLKHPLPGKLPDDLPLDTGLATFFTGMKASMSSPTGGPTGAPASGPTGAPASALQRMKG